MGVLSIVLLVLFVLVSLFLIFLVSIQGESSSSLGGIFGGNDSNSSFGGKTNKVINRLTAWVCGAFLVLAILVAMVNKSGSSSVLVKGAQQASTAAAEAETVAEDAGSAK